MGRVVRIGNGQGFWGDSVDAPLELLTRGPLDYLGLDYLAEVTLSIMMRQKLRDPHKGFAADFTSAQLQQEGEHRVRVHGIKGSPRTAFCKVSASYQEGWKASGQLVISGPRAVDKARLAAEVVWKRLARAGVSFPEEDRVTEILGTGACHPGLGDVGADPPEVVLRLAVRGESRAAVSRFGYELAPLVTAGPPGVTGFADGRPKPQEVVAYWPALIAKSLVDPFVKVSFETV